MFIPVSAAVVAMDAAMTAAVHEASVYAGAECPGCGQYFADALVWTEDETVQCETCDTEYTP